jgi:hypothetical protein
LRADPAKRGNARRMALTGIEDVLTADELDGTAAAYKRVGFDRDALNARGPIVWRA